MTNFLEIEEADIAEMRECLEAMKQEINPSQLFVLWIVMASELLKLMNIVLAETDRDGLDEVDIFKLGAMALFQISDSLDDTDSPTTLH